ncbi:hypothetical protein MASR2M47_42850 [Draconibacterium sp.]
MMRKNIFVLAIALLMFSAFTQTSKAQSNKEETEFIQSIFGMGKKAVVAEFLGIDGDNPFWALYDAYETKRKELGQRTIGGIN